MGSDTNRVNVTKCFLPPKAAYEKYLQRIWDSNWLTNRGALVVELEEQLKKRLEVSNLTLTTNGTLPIQIALKALELTGEVITTPFSYVATTSAIVWENLTPVFVDIHPEYLTIDETKIEAAITEKTTAILATHVYGNPCNVDYIEALANKYNLKVIYDAAHCFGITYKGKSIFNYGDISTCSFHATKIFHTGEGGCFITNDDALHTKLFDHHNFGHISNEEYSGLGINAKMSELQAAMGLAVLEHFDKIKASRKQVVEKYQKEITNNTLQFLQIREGTVWNYHYFPIIFESEALLLQAKEKLEEHNIFPRRYFYPSLNTLPYIDQKDICPISKAISKRVLCLPLFADMDNETQELIIKLINA